MAANELISPKQSNPMAVAEHQNGVRNLRKLSNIYLIKRSQRYVLEIYAKSCINSNVKIKPENIFLNTFITTKTVDYQEARKT